MEFRWLPAHRDNPGNEIADELARKYTEKTQSQQHRQTEHNLHQHKACERRWWKDTIKNLWAKEWSNDRTGKTVGTIFPEPNIKHAKLLHTNSHKATSAILTQMITNKLALRHFLSIYNIEPLPHMLMWTRHRER